MAFVTGDRLDPLHRDKWMRLDRDIGNMLFSIDSYFEGEHDKRFYELEPRVWDRYTLEKAAGMDLKEIFKSGLIGKLTDRDGNILTGGFEIEKKDNSILITRKDGNMDPVEVDLNKGLEVRKDDVIKALKDFVEGKKEKMDSGIKEMIVGEINGLIEKVKQTREILALKSHEDVKGIFAGGALYLDENLIENPLALIHELGEGFIELPEGYREHLTRHTFMRGVGKDVRNAFGYVGKNGNMPEDAEQFIAVLEGRLERKKAGLTDSEKALISWNFEGNRKGKKALFGIQDYLDPAGNAKFTQEVRIINRDLRQAVLNLFLLPQGNFAFVAHQGRVEQAAGRAYRKKYGIDTYVDYFNRDDFTNFNEQLEKKYNETKQASEGLLTKVFIDCPTVGHVEFVNRFIQSKAKKDPRVKKLFVIGNDALAKEAVVDEVKVIAVGTILMNDKRLREDFGLEPNDELLVNTRRRILCFFKNNEIGDLEDDINIYAMTPAELEDIMRGLWTGIRELRITKVNWEHVRDWKDRQDEVLNSL